MRPITRGSLYALLNTLLVGMVVGVGVLHSASLAVLMMVFGLVPGMLAGLLAGALAGALARQPPWLRSIAVLVPAHVVLLSVAALTPVGYALACLPTTFLALSLETRTRDLGSVLPRAIDLSVR